MKTAAQVMAFHMQPVLQGPPPPGPQRARTLSAGPPGLQERDPAPSNVESLLQTIANHLTANSEDTHQQHISATPDKCIRKFDKDLRKYLYSWLKETRKLFTE